MTLIDRLSKLNGPDREVDGIIAETFGYPQEVFGSSFGTSYVDGPDMHYDAATWSGEGKSWSAPYFTASIDAAIALAERVLPDHQTGYLPSFFKDSAYAGIISEKGKAVDLLKSTIEGGATPAIALCIAILRAKEASNGE